MDLFLANLINSGIEDDFHNSDVDIVHSFSLFLLNFAGTSFFLEYVHHTGKMYIILLYIINVFKYFYNAFNLPARLPIWQLEKWGGFLFEINICKNQGEKRFKTILHLSQNHQRMVSITKRKFCSTLGLNVFMGYIACHY